MIYWFFLFGEKMKDYIPRTVFCPSRRKVVGKYDGRSQVNYEVKCKKCGNLIVYNPNEKRTKIRKAPERNQGSGMRFY